MALRSGITAMGEYRGPDIAAHCRWKSWTRGTSSCQAVLLVLRTLRTFKACQQDHLACSNPLQTGCPGILHKDRGFAWIHPAMPAFKKRKWGPSCRAPNPGWNILWCSSSVKSVFSRLWHAILIQLGVQDPPGPRVECDMWFEAYRNIPQFQWMCQLHSMAGRRFIQILSELFRRISGCERSRLFFRGLVASDATVTLAALLCEAAERMGATASGITKDWVQLRGSDLEGLDSTLPLLDPSVTSMCFSVPP